MIELTASEIAQLTDGSSQAEGAVTGIATDSRAVRPGDLFVALAGERADGARVRRRRALGRRARGAGAARPRGPGGRGSRWTTRWRRWERSRASSGCGRGRRWSASPDRPARPRPRTSWRRWSSRTAGRCASRQNENNELGVPLTLARLEPDTEVAVVEMAMRGLGQIAYLADIAGPASASSPHRAGAPGAAGHASSGWRRRRPSCCAALPADGAAHRAPRRAAARAAPGRAGLPGGHLRQRPRRPTCGCTRSPRGATAAGRRSSFTVEP